MMPDPQNKSPRSFQCREYLWEALEQLSQELDCTQDSLLNEALRLFVQSKGRGGPMADIPEPMEPRMGGGFRGGGMPNMGGGMPGMGGARPGMPGGPMGAPPPRPGGMPGMPGMPGGGGMPGMPGARPPGALPPMGPPGGMQGGMQQGGMQQGGMQQGAPGGMPGQPRLPPLSGAPGALPPMGAPGAPRPPTAPPMPGMGAPPGMAPRPAAPMPGGMPGGMQGGMPGAPGGFSGAPRPMPGMQPPAPAPAPAPRPAPGGRTGGTLVAIYEGQQYPVTKEEFVIGRGQKTSDLTIRDSNVSRRHACVVLYNGQYWIVDQQSTNGVEFNGTKVDKKVVEHGDLYKICDHEIQFVYR
ncbi:MAG: FHA domain-containing protein [Polyangiales bacterium]